MISMLKKKITGLVEIVINLKNRKKKQSNKSKKKVKKKNRKNNNKTKRKNWILHTAYVRHNMIAIICD